MAPKIQPERLKERLFSDLFLFLAALIWGFGFVSQRIGALHLGFFGFNGVRFLMAGLVLLPFVVKRFTGFKQSWKWVLVSGLILFAGSTLQQAGLETTSAGAAGFITGVYVVLVPILLSLFWRQPASPITWVCAVGALAGTYLLSTGGRRLDPSTGDMLVLAGSMMWALHVIIMGFAVQRMDVFAFSTGQFLVCGFIHIVLSSVSEPLTTESLQASWLALVYAGLFSAALGFTFQAVGQRHAPAADAALILSLEAVFAAIAGILFLQEKMNWIQVAGCFLILAAIVFAQVFTSRPKAIIGGTQPME